MKIEGTPEEIADLVRRLAPSQDIKPILAPPPPLQTMPDWIPYIGDYPPPVTDRIHPWITWQIDPLGTQITDGLGNVGSFYSCANVKEI